MSWRSRLRRLERLLASKDRCPACAQEQMVRYRRDGAETPRILDEGQELPAPCGVCGRRDDALSIVEIVEVVVHTRAEAQRVLKECADMRSGAFPRSLERGAGDDVP